MSDKTAEGFSTSIYVSDKSAFEECKRLLKLQDRSLSKEIMGFVLRRLDELRGTVKPGTADEEASRKYEELKAKHKKMQDDFDRRKEELKKHEDYLKATEMLGDLGMLANLSNAPDIIPKFTAAWIKTHATDQGFMHEYISLLELSRDKKHVEQRLSELRTASEHEPKDLDAATVTPAMTTVPETPQQNKEKPLTEEEHEENTEEDDDEEESVEEAKSREEEEERIQAEGDDDEEGDSQKEWNEESDSDFDREESEPAPEDTQCHDLVPVTSVKTEPNRSSS